VPSIAPAIKALRHRSCERSKRVETWGTGKKASPYLGWRFFGELLLPEQCVAPTERHVRPPRGPLRGDACKR
jgi:hypothetical protein